MPQHDDMSPERLDDLVDGALPKDSDEQELVQMMSDLRGLEPEAPTALAEKVKALGESADESAPETGGIAPDLWARLSAPFRARPKLAWSLAPTLAVLAIAAVTIPAINNSSDSTSASADAAASVDASGPEEALEALPAPDAAAPPIGAPSPSGESASSAVTDDEAVRGRLDELDQAASDEAISAKSSRQGVPPDALAPSTDPNRPQELFGRTTLGVADATGLSDAAAGAMTLIRDLGGFTEKSEFATRSGNQGRADLVLRVPTDKTESALTGFADLGTIIDQQVSINDLGEELATAKDRVVQINRRISQIRSDLRDTPDDARLQSQLRSAERSLEQAKASRKSTVDNVDERTRFSTLNLTIVVTDEVGEVADENRFVAAIDRAWDRLGGALAGALELLIIASPLILLAGLGVWGLRIARRRSDTGLLAKP